MSWKNCKKELPERGKDVWLQHKQDNKIKTEVAQWHGWGWQTSGGGVQSSKAIRWKEIKKQ